MSLSMTICSTGANSTQIFHRTLQSAFVRIWPMLHESLQLSAPSWVVAALEAQHDRVYLSALPASDSMQALVLGRHDACDLCVEADSLSLRHLAFLFPNGTDERLRVLDLCSSLGFSDPGGHHCRGLESWGGALFRAGSLSLVALPASAKDWPDAPEAAWQRMQPIVRRANFASRELRSGYRPRDHTLSGRLDELELIGEPEPDPSQTSPLVGVLESHVLSDQPSLALEHRPRSTTREDRDPQFPRASLVVTQSMLERGVLLGRYEDRCGFTISDGSVSRVHLCIVSDGSVRWAFDVASTNGTWIDGAPLRCAQLSDAATLRLGREWLVDWMPVL